MQRSAQKPVIGVCSWSLRAQSPAELAASAQSVGVRAVQLGLDPLRDGSWAIDETLAALEKGELVIRSGMMTTVGEDYSTLEAIKLTGGLRPDRHWAANRERAANCAALARTLDIDLVTLHAGFLPENASDPLHGIMIERLQVVADIFAEQGVRLGLETGQEGAATLLATLAGVGRATVGVNFDPANMILYGMGDPVAALDALAPHIFQIHIKDATPTKKPGTWGSEVLVGAGAVDWPAFFSLVEKHHLDCDWMLEREAGEQRSADLRTAREFVEPALARIGRRP